MKNFLKRTKGITIITLAITIIVLIILAGVSVATLFGENGLFKGASAAREKTEIANYQEIINLNTTYAHANYKETYPENILKIIKEELEKEEKFKEAKITGPDKNEEEKKLIIVTKEGYVFYVYEENNKYIGKKQEIEETEINVELKAGTLTSSRSILLTISCEDSLSQTGSCEIYVNDSKVSTSSTYTLTNMTFDTTYNCYAIVKDKLGNPKQSPTIIVKNQTYIANETDIKAFRDAVNSGNSFVGETIEQVEDIDLNGSATNLWTPIGNLQTTRFAGIFKGNGHSIDNVYIDSKKLTTGFFGYVANGAEVIGVNITSGRINGDGTLGGIAGKNDGRIISCSNNSTINSEIQEGRKEDEHSLYTGGIAGYNTGTILYSYNTGKVSSNSEIGKHNRTYVAGIVGYNTEDGNVNSCYNNGEVTSSSTYDTTAGGIVANNYGAVSNSYNKKNISVTIIAKTEHIYIGGIIGRGRIATNEALNCYNTGNISYDIIESNLTNSQINLGGINTDYGTITNCYYLSTCGAAGEGISKSKTQLKALAKTLGSEFEQDTNNINAGYPILTWQ